MEDTKVEPNLAVPLDVIVSKENSLFGLKSCVVVGVDGKQKSLNYTPNGEKVDIPLSLPNFPNDENVFLRITEGYREKLFHTAETENGGEVVGFKEVEAEQVPQDAVKIEAVDALLSAAKYKEVGLRHVEEIKEEREMMSNKAMWKEMKRKNGAEVYQKPIRWVVETFDKKSGNIQDVLEWDRGARALEMQAVDEYILKLIIEVQTGENSKSYFRLANKSTEEGRDRDLQYLEPVNQEKAESGKIVTAEELRKVYDMFGQVTEKTIKWYRKWEDDRMRGMTAGDGTLEAVGIGIANKRKEVLKSGEYKPKWTPGITELLKDPQVVMIDHMAEWVRQIDPQVNRGALNDSFRTLGTRVEAIIMDEIRPDESVQSKNVAKAVEKLRGRITKNRLKHEVLTADVTVAVVALGLERAPEMYYENEKDPEDEKSGIDRLELTNRVKANKQRMGEEAQSVMDTVGLDKNEQMILKLVMNKMFESGKKFSQRDQGSRIKETGIREDFYKMVTARVGRGLPEGVVGGLPKYSGPESPVTRQFKDSDMVPEKKPGDEFIVKDRGQARFANTG